MAHGVGMRFQAQSDDRFFWRYIWQITIELFAKVRISYPSDESWAALVKLIYEVDPMLSPKCRQPMSVIRFIREAAVIDKILNHLQYRFDVLALPPRAPPPSPALDPDNYTWD